MGTVVVKLGTDRSVADHNQGRLIYAKNHDLFYANLKALNTTTIVDHQPLQLNAKSLGCVDIFPQQVHFSTNGHCFCVVSQEEYVIYRT